MKNNETAVRAISNPHNMRPGTQQGSNYTPRLVREKMKRWAKIALAQSS